MPSWSNNKFFIPIKPITFIQDSQDTTNTTTTTTNTMYQFSKSIIHGFKNVSISSTPSSTPSTPSSNTTPSTDHSPFSPLFKSHSHELKRFLRPSVNKHSSSNTTNNKEEEQTKKQKNKRTTAQQVLELDDIKDKYGEIGKLLGAGANGSVHIITRQSDHIKFAIKQFRPKQQTESKQHYFKRCNQEYLIGSSLSHGNIVSIIDFIMIPSSTASQDNLYYEIMEFLPIDLFNVVMSNQMSRFEINCSFKQLLSAVHYLHSQGIAHRDLKLDNCCMTHDGILKLIDFGSAFVFQYPFEPGKINATGVMGSDPYLSPELYNNDSSFTKDYQYDPTKVDVWSLAIIYCCMILRRFPWKSPTHTDANFKTFIMPDNEPHDYTSSAKTHEQLVDKRRELKDSGGDPSTIKFPDHMRQRIHPRDLHGPYKLFRLLPHGARPIISEMMNLNPELRPTLSQIMQDSWINSIDNCHIDPSSHNTIRAKGHHHTVVIDDIPSYKV